MKFWGPGNLMLILCFGKSWNAFVSDYFESHNKTYAWVFKTVLVSFCFERGLLLPEADCILHYKKA